MEKRLISPIIEYMTKQGYIWDCTSEISSRVQQVEFTFSAAGVNGIQIWKPYYFNAEDDLNGSVIQGLQVITRTENVPFADGTSTLSSIDAFGKVILWIVDKSGEVVSTLPLSTLIASRGNTIASAFVKYQRVQFENIVWQNCYLTLADTTGINAGESILFNVFYNPKNEIEE